jgi:hypothetical protein
VYLQITRGAAPRTHYFPPRLPRPRSSCPRRRSHRTTRSVNRARPAVTYPDIRWSRCDLKTVNLLGAVLAKQHAGRCRARSRRCSSATASSRRVAHERVRCDRRRASHVSRGRTTSSPASRETSSSSSRRSRACTGARDDRSCSRRSGASTSYSSPGPRATSHRSCSSTGVLSAPGTPGRITRLLGTALERKLYGTTAAKNPELAGAR